MKRLVYLLTVYVLVHGPQGDQVRSYSGLQEDQILSSIASEGKSIEFITEKEYLDFLVTHKPTVPPPDPLKQQAILDAKNPALDTQTRLNALIKAIDLK